MGQFHAGVDRLGRPEKGCLEKSRTYLAETGWTSPLPGGGLVEALHRRSKVDGTIPRVWLAKQPRRRSPWTSRKRLHFLNSLQGPGCLAKSALSCLVWLASGYQKKRFGWLLAGFWLAFWLDIPLLKLAGPPRCLGGLVEALPLPQTKQSRWHNSTYGLAKQPRRRSPWTSRKRLHFLNSLQGPGCLAKSALSCLVWLASGYQKKRFGFWLLAGGWLSGCTSPCLEKSRTYLAETGWTSPLPGGGLVEALPLPQTKQRRWHNSTRGLAKQPRRRSPWTSRKRLRFLNSLQGPGCLAKSALSCLVWLASGYQKKRFGWLLAGFWLASGWLSGWTSPCLPCLEKSRTYLAETGWTSPLPGGLVEALPLTQTKQSRWRVGLRSSPGVDRLGRPEKGCTSLTPCKAQAALPNQPSLAWFGWLLAIKKKFGWLLAGFWLASGWLSGWTSPCLPCLKKSRTYLAETGWTSPLPGGGLVEALPLPQTKQSRWHNSTRGLAKQPRRRSPWTSRKRLHFLNSLQGPGCLAKSALSCLVWLASGYQKKRFGWLLAGFWLASGWLSGCTSPCLEKSRTYLAETGVAGPPRCLGAALWRHCPSHKRSKVDGTIPRMGLRSSPGVDLALDVPKKAALP